MSQDYAQWKRRADLLHKAQRAMHEASEAVAALEQEGYLSLGMVRPLQESACRGAEAKMWLEAAVLEHQRAGRPEGMSRQDTGRDLEHLKAE